MNSEVRPFTFTWYYFFSPKDDHSHGLYTTFGECHFRFGKIIIHQPRLSTTSACTLLSMPEWAT